MINRKLPKALETGYRGVLEGFDRWYAPLMHACKSFQDLPDTEVCQRKAWHGRRGRMGLEKWCSKCGLPTNHECVGVVAEKFMDEEWRKEIWECQTCRTRKDIFIK